MRGRTTLLILTFAACGGPGSAPRPEAPPDIPDTVAQGGEGAADTTAPAEPGLPTAPWSADALAAEEVAPLLLRAWRAADNRSWCAPLAPQHPEPAATPRAAHFGGGWGVAYDLPELRSAYGVAGTGVQPGPETYDDWPHRIRWADGSRAGYGPEGGSGPKQLAYLRVAGQDCLYNVWSHLGQRHLEELLGRLRRVSLP